MRDKDDFCFQLMHSLKALDCFQDQNQLVGYYAQNEFKIGNESILEMRKDRLGMVGAPRLPRKDENGISGGNGENFLNEILGGSDYLFGGRLAQGLTSGLYDLETSQIVSICSHISNKLMESEKVKSNPAYKEIYYTAVYTLSAYSRHKRMLVIHSIERFLDEKSIFFDIAKQLKKVHDEKEKVVYARRLLDELDSEGQNRNFADYKIERLGRRYLGSYGLDGFRAFLEILLEVYYEGGFWDMDQSK